MTSCVAGRQLACHVQRRGGGVCLVAKRRASVWWPISFNLLHAYAIMIFQRVAAGRILYFTIFRQETCFRFRKIPQKQLSPHHPPAPACYSLPFREYLYASYAHKSRSSSDHSHTQWQPTSQLSHSQLGILQQSRQINQHSESTTLSQDQRISLYPRTEEESTGITAALLSMIHPIWVMPGELVSF